MKEELFYTCLSSRDLLVFGRNYPHLFFFIQSILDTMWSYSCVWRKVVAVAEKGEKPCITIYDLERLKKRKVLGQTPETSAQEFVSLAFSFDGKYLAAVLGDPDWTTIYFNWDKGKVDSTIKPSFLRGGNVGTITQVGVQRRKVLRYGYHKNINNKPRNLITFLFYFLSFRNFFMSSMRAVWFYSSCVTPFPVHKKCQKERKSATPTWLTSVDISVEESSTANTVAFISCRHMADESTVLAESSILYFLFTGFSPLQWCLQM